MRLLIVTMAALLAVVVYFFLSNMAGLDWRMSIHGWIAMILGIVLTLALGGGLMALSFYSARHGYDDRVPTFEPEGGEDGESDPHA